MADIDAGATGGIELCVFGGSHRPVRLILFRGMLLGSFVVAFILKEAGHIRAFAALATVAMASILLLPIFVNEPAWMALRFVHGSASPVSTPPSKAG